MENIIKRLKENGIKISLQRIKILEYLIINKNHPTVETMYRELLVDIPTLSKTTMYNTLNIFVEKKIVNIVGIEENEKRYDAFLEPHGHFKCEKCNSIHDIKVSNISLPTKELNKFKIKEEHLYFKGICNECVSPK